MFIKKSQSKSKLDEAIEQALTELNGYESHEDGYKHIIDILEKLYKLKAQDTPERMSKDTLAMVVGNLLGIIVIVGHERAHVVTSKALNFVLKSR
jgi:hypothetical protein